MSVNIITNESEHFETIAGFLSQESYMVVNLPLARAIGLKEAIVYSNMLSKYRYYSAHNALTEIDGKEYFYSTTADLEKSTTLSRKQQDAALATLCEIGLISKKVVGQPPRRYFHLRMDNYGLQTILQTVQSEVQINLPQTDKLKCPKGTNEFVQKGQQNKYNKSLNKSLKENNSSETGTLPFDLLPDGALKEALLEFREYRKEKKENMSSLAEKKLINALNKTYDDDTEAKVEAINRAIISGYRGVVFSNDREKYLRSKQAAKPRYNPMNPSGSRYTEQELDDLNLPF